MKVGLLIVLLLVGADGFRKKQKTAQKHGTNGDEVRKSAQETGIEVVEQQATTVGRIHCPDNRFDDVKSQVCVDGKTGAILCTGLCDTCCTKPEKPAAKPIHCPDDRFDDEKSQMCIDGKTGAILCTSLCDTCCMKTEKPTPTPTPKPYDPCEDKEVGDVCQLNKDDITPSFLQLDEEEEDGDEEEEEVSEDEQAARRRRRRRRRRRSSVVAAKTTPGSAGCAAYPFSFSQCNFWGDPHFGKSFFSSRKFNFQGIGVYQVASSKDNSFEVQSFQCAFNHNSRASVAVGFAVKMDGKVTFISRKSEKFVSNDKCFRFEVKSRHTGASPGYYHDMDLAIKSDMKSSEGMCGHAAPHNEVPCGAEHLFTQQQVQEMCQTCSHPKPRDCTQACVKPTPAPPPAKSTPPPCENLREAQKACCALEDDVEFEGCVMDYCVAGSKDGEAMADDAVNEVMHDVHTCQLEDDKKKCKPKQKPPPTGRCHRMGFQ